MSDAISDGFENEVEPLKALQPTHMQLQTIMFEISSKLTKLEERQQQNFSSTQTQFSAVRSEINRINETVTRVDSKMQAIGKVAGL